MKKMALTFGAVFLLFCAAEAQCTMSMPAIGAGGQRGPVRVAFCCGTTPPSDESSMVRLKFFLTNLNFPLRDSGGRFCIRFKPKQLIRFQFRF
ncbi:MAG: hypothetical protein H6577_06035 [Lewinellaceae bacterium]|nr:hypothetical protein [Saprospiraceae bacterium]MCB9337667.1 hypothetical protein [Lewinellaceae bacterium]